ncbi:hypothetical protein N7537_011381 [Penicillium hordei]|uniref:Uncharacterized protein n=1 Tax=Penicillium hordei TaxID=40994 RepID=A0AAD6GSP6_9EURO|nr:uncharacterized protein N7537_011381 [Penicillium hordei]KAJ5588703.1 hypothetical protein N7537_011381 [Penicillium hordei]
MPVEQSQQIEVYKLLFEAGLLEHIGQDKKPAEKLPDTLINGKGVLSSSQNTRLGKAIDVVLTHIKEAEEESIWQLPGYNGGNLPDLFEQIIKYAKNDDRGEEAEDALKRIQPIAGDVPQPSALHHTESTDGIADQENTPPVKAENSHLPTGQKDDTSNFKTYTSAPKQGFQQNNRHPNMHTTSHVGGLKLDRGNKSITLMWAEAGYVNLEIEKDEQRTWVLFEIKSARPKRNKDEQTEYISRYGVERYDASNQKFYVTIVDKSEIGKSTAEDWHNIKDTERERKLVHIPSLQDKREDYGELDQFHFCCYSIPKNREAGKAKRTPPVYSCITTTKKPGFHLVTLSKFETIDAKAREYVQVFCKMIGRPNPWETRSKKVNVVDPDCHEPIEDRTSSGGIVEIPRSKNSLSFDMGMNSTGKNEDTESKIRHLIREEVTIQTKELGRSMKEVTIKTEEIRRSMDERFKVFEDNIDNIKDMLQRLVSPRQLLSPSEDD